MSVAFRDLTALQKVVKEIDLPPAPANPEVPGSHAFTAMWKARMKAGAH